MDDAIDAVIAAVALRQNGNITRRQLIALGLSSRAIDYRVRIGRLHRVYPGVYSVGRPARTHHERASAAVLAGGTGAALSHAAGNALWGFVKHWPPSLEVTVTGDRRPAGITVHRSRALTRQDVRRHYGIPVTSPARTLLDCAPRLHREGRLTRVVNDALLTPFLSHSGLADVRERFPTHPGAKLLAPFVDRGDGPTRSEFEDMFLQFCERFGFPRPLVNTLVSGHLVDALFVDAGLIVELDSWRFHRDRQAFESDRDRDADMVVLDLATVRITWERLTETPDREAARLRKIFARRQRRAA
jgi:Transcriptional regulator, AbiEi antitoxin